MKDPNDWMRHASAEALGHLGSYLELHDLQTLLDVLLGTHGKTGLRDKNHLVRDASAYAFIHLAPRLESHQLLSVIEHLLRSQVENKLDCSILVFEGASKRALTVSETESVISQKIQQALDKALGSHRKTGLRSNNPRTRHDTVSAIRRIGPHLERFGRAEEAFKLLLGVGEKTGLRDRDRWVRYVASEVLIDILQNSKPIEVSPEALNILMGKDAQTGLRDRESDVRERSAYLLDLLRPALNPKQLQKVLVVLRGERYDIGFRDINRNVRSFSSKIYLDSFDDIIDARADALTKLLSQNLDALQPLGEIGKYLIQWSSHWFIGGKGTDVSQKVYVPESLEDALALLLPEGFPKELLQPDTFLMQRLVGLLGGWPELHLLLELAFSQEEETVRTSAARAAGNTSQPSETILNLLLATHSNTGLKDGAFAVRSVTARSLGRLSDHLNSAQIGSVLDWILGTSGNTGLKNNDWFGALAAADALGQLANRLESLADSVYLGLDYTPITDMA